jgi:multidrug transporter EmrE-like cation transporter
MAWIHPFIARIFEIGFAMGLKNSEGFTRLWSTLVMDPGHGRVGRLELLPFVYLSL